MSNTNFMEMDRPDESGTCMSEGFRICGNLNGSRSKQTCVEEGKQCPITDIMIENIDSELVKNSSYERHDLGDDRVLMVSRDTDHLPVVQFKLTEGLPCIEEREYDYTKDR